MIQVDGEKIDIKTMGGQKEILYACALRFDGYKYVNEHGIDVGGALQKYRRTKQWNPDPHEKMAAFCLLQRDLSKWGLIYEPFWGEYWWAFRSLFLEVADKDVPDPYQDERFLESWDKHFKPHVQKYTAYIRDLTHSMTIDLELIGTIKTQFENLKKEQVEEEPLAFTVKEFLNSPRGENALCGISSEIGYLGDISEEYCKILKPMLSLGWMVAKGQTVSPFSEDTCHIKLNVLLTGEGKKALAKAQKASKKNKNQNALLKTLNSLQQIN